MICAIKGHSVDRPLISTIIALIDSRCFPFFMIHDLIKKNREREKAPSSLSLSLLSLPPADLALLHSSLLSLDSDRRLSTTATALSRGRAADACAWIGVASSNALRSGRGSSPPWPTLSSRTGSTVGAAVSPSSSPSPATPRFYSGRHLFRRCLPCPEPLRLSPPVWRSSPLSPSLLPRINTPVTRKNATYALSPSLLPRINTPVVRLSQVEEHKITIGHSGAIPLLVQLLEIGGPRGKKDASMALFLLCSTKENKT